MKKRFYIYILAAVLSVCLLCACDANDVINGVIDVLNSTPTPTCTPTVTGTPTPTDVPKYIPDTNYSSETEKKAAELIDDAISAAWEAILRRPVTEEYAESAYEQPEQYHDKLSGDMLKMYNEVLEHVKNIEDYKYLGKDYGTNSGESFTYFITIDDYIRWDNPELTLYFYGNFMTDDYVPIYFYPGLDYNSPCSDYDYIRGEVALLDAITERIVKNMPEGLSTYDKYRYLTAVICERCEYDHTYGTTGMPYQAYNCLVNGTCVCQGYADALFHLCRAANLWCTRVYGYVGDEQHAWNLVKLGGETYYIDATWADDHAYDSPMFTEWFMITEEQCLEGNHRHGTEVKATGRQLPDFFSKR